jgi:hypothetical protein
MWSHDRYSVHASGITPGQFRNIHIVSTPRAVNWQQSVPLPGLASHWSDNNLADAWLGYAASLVTPERQAAINAMPTGAQQDQAVTAVWTAIGQFFRALNIPPTICPQYRSAYVTWVQKAESVSSGPSGSISRTIGQLTSNPLPIQSQFAQRITTTAGHRGSHIIMPLRVNLTSDAGVATQCMGGLVGNACTFADVTGATTISYVGQGEAITATNFPWGSMRTSWKPDPAGLGDDILRVIPPSLWFYQMAQDVINPLMSFGATQILQQSLANQALLNLQTAAGLNPPVLPAQLQLQAAQLPATIQHAQWDHTTVNTFLDMFRAAVAVIPGVGTGISAVLTAIKVAIDATPVAVGVATDPWGRATPVYEQDYLDNTGLAGRPGYTMDVPPSYIQVARPQIPITAPSKPLSTAGKVAVGAAALVGIGYVANALDIIDVASWLKR